MKTEQRQEQHAYLCRLSPHAYRGTACVHWQMTIKDRKTGWLDESFHLQFREVLTHTAFRFGISCPVYCLMPDHLHCLWIGWRDDADQQSAIKYLRKQLNWLLCPADFELQKQPFDNVLREKDRERDAFQAVAWYVRANPVRRNLVASEKAIGEYPYSGCLVPGYPELNLASEDYWERFWKIYAYLVKGGARSCAGS
jgi:REP element-mobilizing transposase RayT